jgi:hypothetical protein
MLSVLRNIGRATPATCETSSFKHLSRIGNARQERMAGTRSAVCLKAVQVIVLWSEK